jgi:MoaA/NifB/PqqE/SkfB family radical SAM enzyme
LSTPFSLQFSPSSYCNFKCSYCWQSLKDSLLTGKFKKQILDYDLFAQAINGCTDFDEPLKMILFAGLGEPLIHPQIDKMIAYAKRSGVAERVELLTNASLLTTEMSDRLINAGLDRLRVSIQGMSNEKYKSISNSSIKFDQILQNVSYFHQHRKGTSIYVKIIDCALDEHEKQRFIELFFPICDDCAVEYLSPFVREINYAALQNGLHGSFRDNGVPGGSRACPLAFYMIAVQADGSVTPWCTADIATVYGHAGSSTLPEIWASEAVRQFWRVQLYDRAENPICEHCMVPIYNVREGDCLDGYEKEIIKRITERT